MNLIPPSLCVLESAYSQDSAVVTGESPQNVSPRPSQDIAVGSDTVQDALILNRLQDVFRSLPDLSEVRIHVTAGVVRLTGQTPSKDAHQQALELAKRTEGVVSVTDDIAQTRDIRERLTVAHDKFKNYGEAFVSSVPLILIGLLVFSFFWILASFVSKWNFLYTRITSNVFLQSLLRQTIKGTILFIGFIIVLEILDAAALLGTMVGIAGVIGLAVGFALRDTVENYIASILLSLRQPFRPLDHIVLEHYEGLVMKLTSRETILMTLDGNHVRIPNATVYKGIILNYSRNPKRRFSFDVGIDTAVNIDDARRLAIATLRNTPGVIADPPVRCFVQQLGDSNVILNMTAWTTQDQFDYLKVKSEAIRNVKEAFDLANYEMPEPIYRLKLQGLSQSESTASLEELPVPKSTPPNHTFEPQTACDVTKDTHIAEQIFLEKEDPRDEEMDLLESETSH